MTKSERKQYRQKKAMGAFALALLSCILGLFFCFAKSPQALSESYVQLAQQAIAQSDNEAAARAAYEAVRLNPASDEAWALLESLLRKNGHADAAYEAKAIIYRLQQKDTPSVPLYAMPAVLRLSLLSLASGDIR